jgi:hypothetical protein
VNYVKNGVGAGQWAIGLSSFGTGNVCVDLYSWISEKLTPAAAPAGITFSWGQFEN